MIVVFLILAAALLWFSFKSFVGGLKYLAFFRSELAKPVPRCTPFATVICPCRGIDDGMEENLGSILKQDHPAFEVIFVVDDEADPAASLINRLLEREESHVNIIGGSERRASKLVIAPKSTNSAQKIENLREAVLHLDPRSEVIVTVDADARPSPTWLGYLVGGLEADGVGAASGYRWFISARPTFASELRSAWNASIASALGPDPRSNFCWGGSTAIRRDVFERLNIREKWIGTLSDDFVVTRAMREAGLEIIHVPQALAATIENCTFGELAEFTTRQMKITRVYMPHLWAMSFVGSAIFNIVMISALLIVVLDRGNPWHVWPAVATLVAVSAFSVGKSHLRLKAVRLALPQYAEELKAQFLSQNTLWLVTPLLFLFNSIAALFSRTLRWRGTKYRLKSPTETVIIRD